jgi:hypothetical protein
MESKPQTWAGCTAITRSIVVTVSDRSETGKVVRPGPMGLCSSVIEVAKWIDPKIERNRRRVVLIFAFKGVPEPPFRAKVVTLNL